MARIPDEVRTASVVHSLFGFEHSRLVVGNLEAFVGSIMEACTSDEDAFVAGVQVDVIMAEKRCYRDLLGRLPVHDPKKEKCVVSSRPYDEEL